MPGHYLQQLFPTLLLKLPTDPPLSASQPAEKYVYFPLTEKVETSRFPKKFLDQTCAQLSCPLGLTWACPLVTFFLLGA